MQIGCLYSTATARIALIEFEKAGVLDEDQRALVAIAEPGGDADAFVLLADADETQIAIARDRPQQAGAGHDIGHREDEFDAAVLDRREDVRPVQFNLGLIGDRRRIHRQSPRSHGYCWLVG